MLDYTTLTFFGELQRSDLTWFFETSEEIKIHEGESVIEAETHPDAIFVVLDGRMEVVSSYENHVIAVLGTGEIFGELSFIECSVASATVRARDTSLLLRLPIEELEEKIELEEDFAARFYRALALTAAGRMRRTNEKIDALRARLELTQEASEAAAWQGLSAALDRLKQTFIGADRTGIQRQGIPEEVAQDVRNAFTQFVIYMNEQLGDDSTIDQLARNRLGARVQVELLPYILLTRVGERMYSKPRGYAGDYLTLAHIYGNQGVGTGRLGPILDRCFLDAPAAQAVRNRRVLLAEEIHQVVQSIEGRPAQVASLAAGPAAEVFDVYAQLDDPSGLHATCVDIDAQALEYLAQKQGKLAAHMDLQHGNLVYLATGRYLGRAKGKLELADQDLVYSIGLIDYFKDRFVVNLLNYIHSALRVGGKVILGNFKPGNMEKAMMDHVLDWRLIHRNEKDLHRLFRVSNFKSDCTSIRVEDEGINLFATCVKSQ